MNHEQWIKLTESEKTERVRNCLGFVKVYESGWWGGYYWLRKKDGWKDHNDRSYLGDLNAMHEAELTMTDEQYSRYAWLLLEGVEGKKLECREYLSASAEQRAEAFIQVMEQV